MAEGDGAIYYKFKQLLFEGEIDLIDQTVRVALLTGHTSDLDAHEKFSDVSGDEESGTGYTAGGEALTSKTNGFDSGSGVNTFDAANVTWTGLDVGTPSHLVAYVDSSDDWLISRWEVTTPTNGGDYTIQWNASGILTIT